MAFTPVKNVRIGSLAEGAVVQLRLGKAAVKSPDDVTIEAKLVSKKEEGEKSLVSFEETSGDGTVSETVVWKFPGAAWRAGTSYVSLVGIDESTFTIQKPASPIETDAIETAIALVTKQAEDVYGAPELVALLKEVSTGTRINTKVKVLADALAKKLVAELESLPDPEPAA